MNLVGAVGQATGALRGVYVGQVGPLRNAGGAVDLDGLVDDLTDPGTVASTALIRTGRRRRPSRSMALAALSAISRMASISIRAPDTNSVLAQGHDRPAERFPGEAALDHQLQGLLGRPD